MKIECPECKSTLVHRRIDDGFRSHKISKGGKVTLISEKSEGSDEVYCSCNPNHKIPDKLSNKVMDLVYIS